MGAMTYDATTRDFTFGAIVPPPSTRMIALTFDDGPPTYTQQVLDILNTYNVDATFFGIGENIEGNQDWPKLWSIAGVFWKTIATLTDLTTLSSTEIRNELQSTSDIIFNVTGTRPEYYRPPYGEHNANVDSIADSLGMQPVIWTVDTNDWDQPGTTEAEIVQSVLQGRPIMASS